MSGKKKTLLERAEEMAKEVADGHLTIMRFTTNWRAAFFTPDSREDIDWMARGKTLDAVLTKILANPENYGVEVTLGRHRAGN